MLKAMARTRQTILERRRGGSSRKAGKEGFDVSRWEVIKTWNKALAEVMVMEHQMWEGKA